ncbi:MAG: PhzF family phenazine biosynthesis protein, partial [Blastocatellia bacterium]
GQGLAAETMQDITREMNYSESTFLLPPEAGGDFKVRIFTPAKEIPFAGHPIVGSSYVIAAVGLKHLGDASGLTLETGVGPIRVEIAVKEGKPGRTTMTQPLPRVTAVLGGKQVESLAEALGIHSSEIARTELPVQSMFNGIPMLVVPVGSLETIRALRVEFGKLVTLAEEIGVDTVLVFTTQTVNPESTVHCRVFGPGAGVIEDAATGSANGPLGFYLVQHKLVKAEAVTRIISEQGFEMKRPSTIFVDVEVQDATGSITDVKVGGDVVITGRGEIVL